METPTERITTMATGAAIILGIMFSPIIFAAILGFIFDA